MLLYVEFMCVLFHLDPLGGGVDHPTTKPVQNAFYTKIIKFIFFSSFQNIWGEGAGLPGASWTRRHCSCAGIFLEAISSCRSVVLHRPGSGSINTMVGSVRQQQISERYWNLETHIVVNFLFLTLALNSICLLRSPPTIPLMKRQSDHRMGLLFNRKCQHISSRLQYIQSTASSSECRQVNMAVRLQNFITSYMCHTIFFLNQM